MYTINECPCCQSGNLKGRWAVVSPFLADYSVKRPPFRCKLLDCLDCSFRFFDVRLTDDEVERLYSGYRGEDYFAARHRWEFWYSKQLNDGIGGDQNEIVRRVGALERFLSPHFELPAIESVLDYGGDRGQFIPQSLGRKKFVFELSNAVPCAGVEGIRSEQELSSMKFDLIMAFGVLEHCSDPAQVLEKLRSYLLPGALLCVAVPHERYAVGFAGRSSSYRKYLGIVLHFRVALIALDFYSTVGRVRLGGIPPLGFVKCHEHLNFFNERSMNALLERTGFDTLSSSIESVAKYPARGEVLQVLARLK